MLSITSLLLYQWFSNLVLRRIIQGLCFLKMHLKKKKMQTPKLYSGDWLNKPRWDPLNSFKRHPNDLNLGDPQTTPWETWSGKEKCSFTQLPCSTTGLPSVSSVSPIGIVMILLLARIHLESLPAGVGGAYPQSPMQISISTPHVSQGFAWHFGHLDTNSHSRQW